MGVDVISEIDIARRTWRRKVDAPLREAISRVIHNPVMVEFITRLESLLLSHFSGKQTHFSLDEQQDMPYGTDLDIVNGALLFRFSQSFPRLILHAVCQYHGVYSKVCLYVTHCIYNIIH